MPISDQDRDLEIRTIIGEAGDQSPIGQAAVAHVIANRVQNGSWGNSPSDVVQARGQFEPWQTRRRELMGISPRSTQYQQIGQIVDGVNSGQIPDPTGGATHFLDPNIVKARRGGTLPSWAQGPTVAIGAHNFYAPDNPNYGTTKALGYTGAPPADPDPLSSWVKALPASDAAAPAAQVPTAPAGAVTGDDPLGAWVKALPSGPASSDVPLPAARPASAGPSAVSSALPAQGEETLPQAAARWTAENQGDSWTNRAVRLGAGALRGVGDVSDTLAQGIGAVGGAGANALAAHGYISPQTNAGVQNWRSGINQGITSDQQAFDVAAGNSALSATGRLGGNVAGAAPFIEMGGAAVGGGLPGVPPVLNAIASGAGAGAAANALTSSASDQPLLDQALSGAGAGAVLGPLGYGAARLGSRLFGGAVDQGTAQLAQTARNQYGIPVTAGQISANPTVRFLDSVMQRLPLTGYGTRTIEQQTALNRAVSNTFGEDVEHITPQVMQNARQRIGAVFDDVATRTGSIHLDQQFATDLRGIVTDARQVLPDSDLRPLGNQIQNIISTFDPATGTLDARSYQALTRKGAPLDRAMQDPNPNIRYYAGHVRDALDDVMQRSAPPDAVQDLIEARSQWKAMKTVEPLAKKAPTGDISPALIMGAVNKSYTGPGTGGDLGNLGRIGQRFLKEPPSSGTAERNMIMQHLPQLALGATGLGGLAAAEHFDPDSWQRNALLAAGAIGVGRVAGSALRSSPLANAMIRSGLRAGQQPLVGQNAVTTLALPAAGALVRRNNGALTAQSP